MISRPRWIVTVTEQAKGALPCLPWSRGQLPVLVLRPVATAAPAGAFARMQAA